MSFYDDASLVFLAGGAAGKDGTAFNLKPVEELTGPNKVINGGFDSDSDWSKGTGWSISGGLASCDGTQTGNTGLSQLLSSDRLEEGETYKVTYTISNYVAGNVNPHIRGTSTGNVNGNGTKVVYGIAGNSSSYDINFFADSNFNASIDNVLGLKSPKIYGRIYMDQLNDKGSEVPRLLRDLSHPIGSREYNNYYRYGGK